MLSAEVPENLRIRTEVLSGGGRPVKCNAALAAISEVVLLRLIWPADGVTLGPLPSAVVLLSARLSQDKVLWSTENKQGQRRVGGRPPTSKLCKIRTLAIYNPGSHREAVPLWPFSGRVAARSHSPLTGGLHYISTGCRRSWAWEGAHVTIHPGSCIH